MTKKKSNQKEKNHKSVQEEKGRKYHEKGENKKNVSTKPEEKIPPHYWISLISLVLAIFVVVGIGFSITYEGKDREEGDEGGGVTIGDEETGAETTGEELTVIEPRDCPECETDEFIEILRMNVMQNLEVSNVVDPDSDEGQQMIEDLGVESLPVYLFNTEIDQNVYWNEIAQVFESVQAGGEEYYMMTEVPGNKELLSEPQLHENTVTIGDENAPVTVYEFSDYNCPFCALIAGNEEMIETQSQQIGGDYNPPVPAIMETYVEQGEVKYVFFNFPLGQDPAVQPETPHLAALCADEQGSWKEYSDTLFLENDRWSGAAGNEPFVEIADDLGLDTNEFEQCLDEERFMDQIEYEREQGLNLGISGTPALIVDDVLLAGAQDFEVYEGIIENKLN